SRCRPALQRVRACHPHLAALLGEALDPAASHREVLVHPDERAGGDLLPVEQGADDEIELAVMRADGIEQLLLGVRARLPVSEHRRTPARVRVRLESLWQQRRRDAGIGVEVDHQEVPDVVPRWWRHQAGGAARRTRRRVALKTHARTRGSGSGIPSISRLSRSESMAAWSKRKYERGGSGPQVLDECRSSGHSRGWWSASSCSMSQYSSTR